MGGVNLLTDPQWSERASPVSWAGPRRLAPPALRFEDLPPIQAVLISHNHYDHLDRPTVRRLMERDGDRLCFYVPLGLGKWFARVGRRPNVVELNWGDAVVANGSADCRTELRCAPAQHWSSRTPFDRRRSLWCGWSVDHDASDEANARRVLFAGDTGWSEDLFHELGWEHGPFDLALLPTGAYAPRWFMADQHADPRDAVRIHRAVRARRSLGMHWGTFVLTDEPPAEPPWLLARALVEAGVAAAEFRAARLGETVVV